MISLKRCNECCPSLHDPCARICIPNKTKVINLNVLDMTRRKNESKVLTKKNQLIVNVNLMIQNLIQIKSRINICADLSSKIQ